MDRADVWPPELAARAVPHRDKRAPAPSSYPSLYVRLSLPKVVSRLIRRHGSPQAALVAVQWRIQLRAGTGRPLVGFRQAFWLSATTSLARRCVETDIAEKERLRERTRDVVAGIAWWNELPPLARELWMSTTGSTVPADCWAVYKAWSARQGGALSLSRFSRRAKPEPVTKSLHEPQPGDVRP
jgi:hypothetical protein